MKAHGGNKFRKFVELKTEKKVLEEELTSLKEHAALNGLQARVQSFLSRS